MNTERIMSVIAEELGVELGEHFKIKGSTNHCDFFLNEDGLYYKPLDESLGYCIMDDSHLIFLIYGTVSIEKLPWQPKLGEKYYYPCSAFDPPVNDYYWCGDTVDFNIKKHVGVYKTEEEALEKAKELGWVE